MIAAIYSKELEFGSNKKSIKGQAEGLFAKGKGDSRGRSEGRERNNKSPRTRSKSRSKKGCWNCGEDATLRRLVLTRAKARLDQKTITMEEESHLVVIETLQKQQASMCNT